MTGSSRNTTNGSYGYDVADHSYRVNTKNGVPVASVLGDLQDGA